MLWEPRTGKITQHLGHDLEDGEMLSQVLAWDSRVVTLTCGSTSQLIFWDINNPDEPLDTSVLTDVKAIVSHLSNDHSLGKSS